MKSNDKWVGNMDEVETMKKRSQVKILYSEKEFSEPPTGASSLLRNLMLMEDKNYDRQRTSHQFCKLHM